MTDTAQITPPLAVGSRYGAPMGRRSDRDMEGQDCHLERVSIDNGGYDAGGAYWGNGAPLYRLMTVDGAKDAYFRDEGRGAKNIASEDYNAGNIVPIPVQDLSEYAQSVMSTVQDWIIMEASDYEFDEEHGGAHLAGICPDRDSETDVIMEAVIDHLESQRDAIFKKYHDAQENPGSTGHSDESLEGVAFWSFYDSRCILFMGADDPGFELGDDDTRPRFEICGA